MAVTPERLVLSHDQVLELADWVRGAYPAEACGLLVGRRSDPAGRVAGVELARNAEESRPRRRFALAPEDHLRVELDARERGLEVIGVWHSHPDGPATPGAADRAGAWEGHLQLVAGADPSGPTCWRLWRLEGTRFVELELVLE